MKRILPSIALFIFSIIDSLAQEAKSYFEGERTIVEASINSELVKYAFGTGSDFTVLFSSTAKRLELKTGAKKILNVASTPVELRQSNPVEINMFGIKRQASLAIFPVEDPPRLGGIFSWRDLPVSVLVIDGEERRVDLQKAPPEGKRWQKWSTDPGTRQLFFNVTDQGKPLGRVSYKAGQKLGVFRDCRQFMDSGIDKFL